MPSARVLHWLILSSPALVLTSFRTNTGIQTNSLRTHTYSRQHTTECRQESEESRVASGPSDAETQWYRSSQVAMFSCTIAATLPATHLSLQGNKMGDAMSCNACMEQHVGTAPYHCVVHLESSGTCAKPPTGRSRVHMPFAVSQALSEEAAAGTWWIHLTHSFC